MFPRSFGGHRVTKIAKSIRKYLLDRLNFFSTTDYCLKCEQEIVHICTKDSRIPNKPQNSYLNHLYDIFIDEDKIEKIMSNFDATNAMGPEGIPAILLKKCSKSLLLPLTIL